MTQILVNDTEYEVFPLVGRQGLMWPYRLARYLRGFVPVDGGEFDIQTALTQFFDTCTEKEFVEFAEGMLDTCHHNGKSMKVLYSVEFQGNPLALFQLIIEITKHHFSGFFSALETSDLLKTPAAKPKTGKKIKIED